MPSNSLVLAIALVLVAGALALTLVRLRWVRNENRLALAKARLMQSEDVTGLPDRSMFNARMARHLISLDGRKPQPFSLIHAEIRGYRPIAEHLGQARFDEVLRQIVGNFRKALREGDYVARIAPEHFVFMLPDRPDRNLNASMNALCSRLNQPLENEGETFRLVWTMGGCHAPEAGASPQTLLRAAMKPQRHIGSDLAPPRSSPREYLLA